jgi:hypothetical protein
MLYTIRGDGLSKLDIQLKPEHSIVEAEKDSLNR